MHLGDDRLGNAVNALHHLGASVEQLLVEADVPAHHLPEVVAGGEGRARPLDDHDLRLRAYCLERADDLLHQRQTESVALLRPVEHEPGDRPILLQDHVLQLHEGLRRGWSRSLRRTWGRRQPRSPSATRLSSSA